MATPTDDPTWGTDTNFDLAGDDYDSTPVRVDPTAPISAQGFRPGQTLPAQHLNFILGVQGDWIEYGLATRELSVRVDHLHPIDGSSNWTINAASMLIQSGSATGAAKFLLPHLPGAIPNSVVITLRVSIGGSVADFDLHSATYTGAITNYSLGWSQGGSVDDVVIDLNAEGIAYDPDRIWWVSVDPGQSGDQVRGIIVEYDGISGLQPE